MPVNSLEKLLAQMKEGPVTQGWGAVSVFSRSRLNRLLEQQYIERFNGQGFLPPFTGRISSQEGSHDYVELEHIGLGQPQLSFTTASLTDSTAVLTMNIIAGRYQASRQLPGAPTMLLSAFNMTEAQGCKLELDIDLSMVVGEVDKRGKVKLNLSQGVNFRCNIAGDDELANKRFASFFKQRFEELPEHRSVFQLGMLDLKGYNYLTPTSFRVLTQAAPGAKTRGALNYGDGGVVVFIRLRGNPADGKFPPTAEFPYLIPDDQESDGSDKYSASLILSEAMIPHVEDERLDVLNNLLFPGENIFEERERHVPRDLAVFGNISAKQTKITLEPAFKTLKAGDSQRFTLLDWQGKPIQASKWSAVSLQSHRAEGHGTITNGLYTAASRALIGHASLHVVVTAEYVNAGITYKASALLLVVFDEMTVAPRLATYATAAQASPIVLTASTVDATSVKWTLMAPEYGTLVQSGQQGLFTPDARARVKSLVVQQIEASGVEKRQSSLAFVNAQQLLRVDPPYVPAQKKSVVIPLKDDATLLPGVPRRWKVIGGGGTVDATGRFTAPAQGNSSSSVVQCEIVRNGVVLSSGYSVIEYSEMDPEPSWKDLAQFTIKVPGGLDNSRLGSLYGNGYQQLRAEILVETIPVEDQDYPLSVIEKASMRLVNDASKGEMKFVDDALEGIPEDDKEMWRARLITNRFELAFPSRAAQADSIDADLDPISQQDIYIHTREPANSTATFHVTFQADSDQRWWKSTDITDLNNKIQLTSLPIPVFQADDYQFIRKRVDGGSGAPGAPEEDDFDFHLRTVDYWTLKYTGNIGVKGTTFETLEFLPIDGKEINTSMVRWESEQLREKMFSWTGYIFKDPQSDDAVTKVKFDESVKNVTKTFESLDIDVNQMSFESGVLIISLHRSDKVPYVRAEEPARAKLSRPLMVFLIDKRGNPHKRRIDFLPVSRPDDRNYLEHIGV